MIEKLDPDRPVCLTGHSLGGSVAALLLAVLGDRGFTDVPAVTFGQPKVTDAHGATASNHLELVRVVL